MEFARSTPREFARSTPKEFARSTPREFARSTPKEFARSTPKEFARSTPKEFARSTPKEFARSTPKEFARSTPKEFARSTPREFARSTPREFARSTQKEFARSTPKEFARSTPKEFARSPPKEFARSTPKEFANSSPGFITLGGDNNADNNSERVGQLLRSCNSEEHEYSQGINPGLELANAFGVTLRPADLQNLQDATPPEFSSTTMKQSRRARSIVPHDYRSERGNPPETAQAVAGHRRSCYPMDLSPRRQSRGSRHQGFRLRRDGFARARDRARDLVGVLQSRTALGTLRCARFDCRGVRRHVATQTRLDVAAVAVCLRNPHLVASVCRLGRRDQQVARSSATRDDGRNDFDWNIRLAVN